MLRDMLEDSSATSLDLSSFDTSNVTEITPFGCKLTMDSTDAANTMSSAWAIYLRDRTTQVWSTDNDTPAKYEKIVEGLQPNTQYSARFRLRTVRSEQWSDIVWVDFTTLHDSFVYLIDENNIKTGPFKLKTVFDDASVLIITKERFDIIE